MAQLWRAQVFGVEFFNESTEVGDESPEMAENRSRLVHVLLG